MAAGTSKALKFAASFIKASRLYIRTSGFLMFCTPRPSEYVTKAIEVCMLITCTYGALPFLQHYPPLAAPAGALGLCRACTRTLAY